jgi:transglutaminase-like putative cysteine protease
MLVFLALVAVLATISASDVAILALGIIIGCFVSDLIINSSPFGLLSSRPEHVRTKHVFNKLLNLNLILSSRHRILWRKVDWGLPEHLRTWPVIPIEQEESPSERSQRAPIEQDELIPIQSMPWLASLLSAGILSIAHPALIPLAMVAFLPGVWAARTAVILGLALLGIIPPPSNIAAVAGLAVAVFGRDPEPARRLSALVLTIIALVMAHATDLGPLALQAILPVPAMALAVFLAITGTRKRIRPWFIVAITAVPWFLFWPRLVIEINTDQKLAQVGLTDVMDPFAYAGLIQGQPRSLFIAKARPDDYLAVYILNKIHIHNQRPVWSKDNLTPSLFHQRPEKILHPDVQNIQFEITRPGKHHDWPAPTAESLAIPEILKPIINPIARPDLPPEKAMIDITQYFQSMTYDTDPDRIADLDFKRFLDEKRGYCAMFAQGAALALRASGIPADIITGFVGGRMINDDLVIIDAGHAHAWVRAWINHHWIILDPTPVGARTDNIRKNHLSLRWQGVWVRRVHAPGFALLQNIPVKETLILAMGLGSLVILWRLRWLTKTQRVDLEGWWLALRAGDFRLRPPMPEEEKGLRHDLERRIGPKAHDIVDRYFQRRYGQPMPGRKSVKNQSKITNPSPLPDIPKK